MSLANYVLLVEDDEDDKAFFLEALQAVQPTLPLQWAKNGDEALAMLRLNSKLPECIFMDINMPGMDGIDCLKQIKNDARLRPISVIMLSTSMEDVLDEKLQRLGALSCMRKPTSLDTFINILMTYLVFGTEK